MKYELKKESGVTANFSIILPGGCNAKCEFCFWNRSKSESPMYAQQLHWYLSQLGNKITQISITGGEPTISPEFDNVMRVLSEFKQNKIVITSNGSNLLSKIDNIKGVVRHLNISRHHVDDEINSSVFNSKHIPTKKELSVICEVANKFGIDVTLNRVISHDYSDMDDLEKYIQFSKEIGASAVALRKDYNVDTLENTPIESKIGVASVERSCPVCVTNSYVYKGMPVHFKMSLKEPSDSLSYIYEFIYHPNGNLCEDWLGEKIIEFVHKIEIPENFGIPVRSSTRNITSYSSCGQSSRSSGC